MSALTGVPEFGLDPDEARELSAAAADVARWYNPPKVMQKTIDWTTLATVLVGVYGTRVASYRIRTAEARARAKAEFEARRRAAMGQPTPTPPPPTPPRESKPGPSQAGPTQPTDDPRLFIHGELLN